MLHVPTWHIHGSHLYYLAQVPCEFYPPVKPRKSTGYEGRAGDLPWPANVHDVPADEVREMDDLVGILYQSKQNYIERIREAYDDLCRRRRDG